MPNGEDFYNRMRKKMYLRGKEDSFDHCNLDVIPLIALKHLTKELNYSDKVLLYYKRPGMNLNDGFIVDMFFVEVGNVTVRMDATNK